MNFVLRLLTYSLAILITSYLIPGVELSAPAWAIGIAAVLMLLNTLLKPFLIILTLPLTVLSFGLFLFVINAIVILLAGAIVPGFAVKSFWAAMAFSVVLTLIMAILEALAEYSETR
ncbi:MAG: phage holin family protein [Chitinophagales bacterium]|nr:phage holin family protein [Chitinophagales bacterium]MDW8427449.1 phage holin family protein [Chitinophagales bacterium]